MNRLIIIIISLTFCPLLLSQNLKLAGSVVSSGGGHSTGSGNKLSWTIGEPVADILSTANYSVTLGFQQNWDKIVGVEDIMEQWQAVAYPNPATESVSFSFGLPVSSEILIELLNISGAKVYIERRNGLLANEPVYIDLSSLKEGLYFLRISSPGKGINRVFKIVKQ